MPNAQKDQLFLLVKSLNRAEKRNFTLYVNRAQSNTEQSNSKKFMHLFEALDKMAAYDEKVLLEKLKPYKIKKQHLANLKRHLYKQILTTLRLIHIQKNIDIEIREQLDFARILYGKGMYMQALKILERIKQTALEHQQDILHLEILEFEKHIEARHITRSRSVKGKLENLLEESAKRSRITLASSLLFNLNIEMQGYYIMHGHIRSDKDGVDVEAFYKKHFPPEVRKRSRLTFFEKVNLSQARMWYAYILLKFPDCLESALEWVQLFEQYPQMKEKDPDLYMRALYYVMMFLYFLREPERHALYLQEFEMFYKNNIEQLNTNSETIAFVYLYLAKLNQHLMTGAYDAGVAVIEEAQAKLNDYRPYSDIHRILLFHYKFAYFYFASAKYDTALEYLNEVVMLKHGYLREDLHHNARLLQLICHYELENYDLLSYLVKNTHRAFVQAKDVSEVQKSTLAFLKNLITTPPSDQRIAFVQFQQELTPLTDSPYERKALLYLDIPGWVESHVQNRPLREVRAARENQRQQSRL